MPFGTVNQMSYFNNYAKMNSLLQALSKYFLNESSIITFLLDTHNFHKSNGNSKHLIIGHLSKQWLSSKG